MLSYLNLGLFMVDNIHFQYNSMMYGLFILAVHYIVQERYLKSAFFYAVLLNFKHIYLYSAPAFGIMYLKGACFAPNASRWTRAKSFVLLAVQTLVITVVISFGPFIMTGQLSQIVSRLFPFDRGLVHDYMAANVWELHIIFNKYVLNFVRWF